MNEPSTQVKSEMKPQLAPYGTWKSPISAEMIATEGITINHPQFAARKSDEDKTDGKIYYLERRASGKTCIVEAVNKQTRDVLSDAYDVRSKVHEYGGGVYAVMPTGDIIFTNAVDNAVCKLQPNTGNVEVVFSEKNFLYADFSIHPTEPLVAAIEEEHPNSNPGDVLNRLVVIDISSATRTTLVEGADFYNTPRFSPDGSRVCWLQWNHPDMPWIGAQLYVADFEPHGKPKNITLIAGKSGEESVNQPLWAPDGRLFFSRNQSGYWQFSYLDHAGVDPRPLPLQGLEHVDFGAPDWQVGNRSRVFISETTMVATYTKQARDSLITIDVSQEKWQTLDLPICAVGGAAMAGHSNGSFLVLGSTETSPAALHHITLKPTLITKVIKTTLDVKYSSGMISIAQHITCPTADDLVTHGFYYSPKNPNYTPPPDKLAPVICFVHGGPTGSARGGFNPLVQYFTTRGYAVFDVNHRGSTGYGRDYIQQLNHNWGIADADDAVAAVSYLASQNLVDGTRAGIRGGSAGGYTTLQALCASPIWAGGVSLFGISDLRAMTVGTHKFESQYLNALLYDDGMTETQKEERLRERSAISHVERIKSPLLVLQGSEDKVVPRDQAETMVEIARKAGLDVEMVVFDGEGHGWRMGTTIKKALEDEEKWWQKTLLKD